ncbi:DEAD/DEAH box helicase [Catenuloplanes sp. NPDC051500]|uniref:DEAD/DEAH box helicase n=1 Tax=Catenuloplanes sp. NPDC051500 TaxID=3363959 RepID=UPI0037ADC713
MARLALTQDEAAICEAVGTRSFLAARAILADGDLTGVRWNPTAGQGHAVVRGPAGGVTTAAVKTEANGTVRVDGDCTCEAAPGCSHPIALALAGYQKPAAAVSTPPRKKAASWEPLLAALMGTDSRPDEHDVPDLALQVELEGRRVGLRPAVPGKRGWVRTGISWSTLHYAYRATSPRAKHHVRLLQELRALAEADERELHRYAYYGGGQRVIYLDDFQTRRVWDVLAEAQEAGLPLVQSGRTPAPVTVSAPVRFSVHADRDGADLRLRPMLMSGGEVIDPADSVMIGDPAHGIAWWGAGPLRLAPAERPLTDQARRALAVPAIVIPAADEQRFLRQYYPGMMHRSEIVAAGEAGLPDIAPALLTLTVHRLPEHRMSLTWDWISTIGTQIQREPLRDGSGETADRAATVRRAAELVAGPEYGMTEPAPGGQRLRRHVMADGDLMLRIIRDILPRVAEADGLALEFDADGDLPDYVEEESAPVVSFSSDGQADWFDLAVRVTVGGEDVGFDALFLALAAGQQFMILPSGRYFTLDRNEFRQLRELITESRELQDAPPGVLRVGRFQAGLWQELSELGVLTGQAAAWQESIRALSVTGAGDRATVPAALQATLRPYQLEGFEWLAALYRHGLGGVLADDMGLGKTLQALALICHAGAGVPFLVVAPASVVGNWAQESARFAPHLRVSAVVQTGARRPGSLRETVEGADIVVTSYTLFRLEYDDYAALPWAGLILDEAQFVKNSQSHGYRYARQLPVPFKLAITGTPMENNLGELWALLSITAPGLLPRPDRFTDYYRKPIEKDHDEARLAQLRRRIRPLMLRRRKSEVVTELPPKQEQIVELELNPKHRRMYQTYLQRERQKVLGLLGDLQKNRFEIFRSLTLLRQASLDIGLVDPKHANIPSTKLDVLSDRVTDLVAEGHRVLIFSQFTRFLTAARHRLQDAGIDCLYLDGKSRDRARIIDGFKSGIAPVFLVSLKSGGFGLNLTEADYCILLDPWWNPATEAQAVDRVHRIGQTRTVMVYRFVAKDTIEEKVMALQARKAELFSSVLDGGEFADAALTSDDIRTLLE